MNPSVWLLAVAFLIGCSMLIAGTICKDPAVRAQLGQKEKLNFRSYSKADKLSLGLRILQSIYCVKGTVSWTRVFCICLILNSFLYVLISFASMGLVFVEQLKRNGAPPDFLPDTFAQTIANSWRLIDITDLSVVASIAAFFVSAAAADLAAVYSTLAFYRQAIKKNSLWPIILNVCLTLLFLYVLPYLYLDHKNKPFLAYLLGRDYFHYLLFGLPGSQMYLIHDSFAYRSVLFSDQRAFQLLGLLAPMSAIIPISLVILSLPLSLVQALRRRFGQLRMLTTPTNAERLVQWGGVLTTIAGGLLAFVTIQSGK